MNMFPQVNPCSDRVSVARDWYPWGTKKRPPSTAPTVFSQGPNRSNILEEVIG